MSRAFVKELDDAGEGLPRPQSPHANYVTPRGLGLLREKVRALEQSRSQLIGRDDLLSKQSLLELDRDLNYFNERIKCSILVDPEQQDMNQVHFGAVVEVEDSLLKRTHVTIVGEDEANVTEGRISWVSPLAKALMNAEVGDEVTWHRPLGDMELKIIAIRKAS